MRIVKYLMFYLANLLNKFNENEKKLNAKREVIEIDRKKKYKFVVNKYKRIKLNDAKRNVT